MTVLNFKPLKEKTMSTQRLTLEDKEEITAVNAERFTALCPDYYGSATNSVAMEQWLISQIGDFRKEGFYPWTTENFWAAYEHLSGTGGLEPRPPSLADQQLAEERQQQTDAIAEEQRRADAEAETLRNAPTAEQIEQDGFIRKMKSAGSIPGVSEPLTKDNLARLRVLATQSRIATIRESGRDVREVLSQRSTI
ncbi:MAG: hypothetical protein LAN36_11480 [Acidobacteriia bacterium]|nr:hypothetical protein [Terriglobia bacterium]